MIQRTRVRAAAIGTTLGLAVAFEAGCTTSHRGQPSATPTAFATFTPVPTSVPASATSTRTATVSATPVPTVPAPCILDGDFESGALNGWTFTTSCTGTVNCSQSACAAAVPQGPQNGCAVSGACCCTWGSICPGLFNQVATGAYSGFVFSGEGGGGCGGPANSWGEISQSFVASSSTPNLSFNYAMSSESSAGTVEFEVASGGSCGSSVVWYASLSTCQAWQSAGVSLAGLAGCTITVRMRATSQSALCIFGYLDDVFCY